MTFAPLLPLTSDMVTTRQESVGVPITEIRLLLYYDVHNVCTLGLVLVENVQQCNLRLGRHPRAVRVRDVLDHLAFVRFQDLHVLAQDSAD